MKICHGNPHEDHLNMEISRNIQITTWKRTVNHFCKKPSLRLKYCKQIFLIFLNYIQEICFKKTKREQANLSSKILH